jgi:hypothetical protein
MKFKLFKLIVSCVVVSVVVPGMVGCRKSDPQTTEVAPTSSPRPAASPLTGFEKDLQYVKNGSYTYIWVFARKDGKPFDRADSDFLRKNAPQVVDWVTTDEGKKVIAGTNFNLEEGNLSELKKRFVAEDYSGR